MTILSLFPSEIRYTQDSIGNKFGRCTSHRNTFIGETLDDLLLRRCSVYDIPRINVIRRNEKYYTADNRRLWVFKKAEELGGCDRIPVYVSDEDYIPSIKWTTYNDGESLYVRGNPRGWHWTTVQPRPKRTIVNHVETKKEIITTPSSTIINMDTNRNHTEQVVIDVKEDEEINDENNSQEKIGHDNIAYTQDEELALEQEKNTENVDIKDLQDKKLTVENLVINNTKDIFELKEDACLNEEKLAEEKLSSVERLGNKTQDTNDNQDNGSFSDDLSNEIEQSSTVVETKDTDARSVTNNQENDNSICAINMEELSDKTTGRCCKPTELKICFARNRCRIVLGVVFIIIVFVILLIVLNACM